MFAATSTSTAYPAACRGLTGQMLGNPVSRTPAVPALHQTVYRNTQAVGQHDHPWLVQPFASISLKKRNANASMMVRRDNKYVVHSHKMQQAVLAFAKHFDVLEIDGQRHFTYETFYFDDAEYSSYHDHQRGRRKRFKARIRKYTDAQLCFLELKFKDKRGVTVKKRQPHPIERYGALDADQTEYIRSTYRDLYKGEFDGELRPTVETHTQRTTLVAKDGGERMTIDFNLEFINGQLRFNVDPGLFIVETKSANANGIADKILRSLHLHPTKRCSKYCMAMAALQVVDKHNNFLPALRKLDAVPEAGALPAPSFA